MDRVVLYPTFGHPSADSRSWHVGVSGVVYRPGRNNLRRRMFLKVLQRLLGINSDQLESDLLQQRMDHFLVNTVRGREITIQLGGKSHSIGRRSKRNGHFRGSIELSRDEVAELVGGTENGPAQIQLSLLSGHITRSAICPEDAGAIELATAFDGEPPASEPFDHTSAQLIGTTGLSVISDIDDTIKRTEVTDRKQMLRNTFLRDFDPVPGMAELYRAWGAEGAAFHYVSSSPWQLFLPLQNFLTQHQFPQGSFHLRAIRLRDPSVLRLFIARRATKRRVIRSIVKMFPDREFILVGDSGEKDPEIYGGIARRFPRRIRRILIRQVGCPGDVRTRFERAFRDLPEDQWRTFSDPADIADEASCVSSSAN